MIKYRLGCNNGHEFDAWFRNSAAYDAQLEHGQLSCASCGSVDIDKRPMAPSVLASLGRERSQMVVKTAKPQVQNAVQMALALRRQLLKNSEDVGERFPEEARRIHYGESSVRTIHGVADTDEVRDLVDEGIAFSVVPGLPEDHH